MNYIGIDIGSTASKVAVKEIMIYILYCDRMEQQRNLPDDQGSFTGRWYRRVIERFESCRNRIWPCCRRFC